MSRTAHDAARTWTLRRYVGRLAGRAAPHDYRGQLRQVYADLVDRWRYVQEPDEFVHGTARSLLGYVLGTRYARRGPRCRSDVACDVLEAGQVDRGWGDCDDVSTLVAACALALGMRPRWRVAAGPGMLHVSVEVETPSGERVSIDPVAYPRHGTPGEPPGFAWGVTGPQVIVRLVELEPDREGAGDMRGIGGEVQGVMQPGGCHWCAVPRDDRGGPRVLAMSGAASAAFGRGYVVDGTPGVDQYGQPWRYSAGLDLWVPASQYGQLRTRRPGLVRLRRGLQRVVQGARKVVGKVLSNKWVSRVIGGALQAFGVPFPITIAMLRAVGGVMTSGGLVHLIKLARKNPKEALRVLAQAVFDAGRSDLLKRLGGKFSGPPEDAEPVYLSQPGGDLFAAPVAMMVGSNAIASPAMHVEAHDDDDPADLPDELPEAGFGAGPATTTRPTPGAYYQAKGESFLALAGRAIGVSSGARRLSYAKRVAAHPANASTLRRPKGDFERANFPGGLPATSKRPLIYFPLEGELPAPGPAAPLPGPVAPPVAPLPGPLPPPPGAPAPAGSSWLPVAAAIGLAMAL